MTNLLYDLLLTVPCSLFACGIYRLYFLSDESKIAAYLISAATAAIITFYVRLKNKWKIVSAVSVPGIAFITAVIAKKEYDTIDLSKWLQYAVVLSIAAAVTAAAKIAGKYVRAKGIAAILVFSYLVFSMIAKKNLCKADTISAGIIILTAVTELIQKYWKKEGYTDGKKHTLAVAPFYLAVFAVMIFVKTPDKPYDWKFFINAGQAVKQGYIAVTEKILKSNKEGYISVFASFSEDGELHPDISQSKNRVMIMEADGYAPAKLYLAGLISNDFDGVKWKNSADAGPSDIALDAAESLYGAYMYAGDDDEDYVRIEGGKLRFTYFNTKIAFLPEKTVYFKPLEEKTTFSEYEGTYHFDKMQGYGTEYDFRYVILNSESPAFRDFANASHEVDRESFEKFTNDSYYENIKNIDYDDLLAHKEEIYDIYLPETQISSQARILLDDIVKDCETPYEKLKAIEEYLRNYDYTLHPGEMPEYSHTPEGFLDYFLFENKQGYCAYYSTAFVLMARAEGIPARYVQGYCISAQSRKKSEVKGYMAHAWPEAYIEGVGWIQFEPTGGGSGYADGQNYWSSREEIEAALAEKEEYYRNLNGMNQEAFSDYDIYPKDSEVDKNDKPEKKIRITIIVPIALAMATLLIITYAERLIQKRRFQKSSVDEQIRIVDRMNLKLLKILGFGLLWNETLEEYQKRLLKDLPSETLGFIIVYERLLYSGKGMTKDDLKIALESNEAIFKTVRDRRGKIVYLIQKCLSGVI